MGHCILCKTFTLQLIWDRDLYLYFGLVSVPIPFPHKLCLNKPLNMSVGHIYRTEKLGFLVFLLGIPFVVWRLFLKITGSHATSNILRVRLYWSESKSDITFRWVRKESNILLTLCAARKKKIRFSSAKINFKADTFFLLICSCGFTC